MTSGNLFDVFYDRATPTPQKSVKASAYPFENVSLHDTPLKMPDYMTAPMNWPPLICFATFSYDTQDRIQGHPPLFKQSDLFYFSAFHWYVPNNTIPVGRKHQTVYHQLLTRKLYFYIKWISFHWKKGQDEGN